MYSNMMRLKLMKPGDRAEVALAVYETVELMDADLLLGSAAERSQIFMLREIFDQIAINEMAMRGELDCVV